MYCFFLEAREKITAFAKSNLSVLPSLDVLGSVDKTHYAGHLKSYHDEAHKEIVKAESTKCCWFCLKALSKRSSKTKDRLSEYTGLFGKITEERWQDHLPAPVVKMIEEGLSSGSKTDEPPEKDKSGEPVPKRSRKK